MKPHPALTPLPGYNTRPLRHVCQICGEAAQVSWPTPNSPHCWPCVHRNRRLLNKRETIPGCLLPLWRLTQREAEAFVLWQSIEREGHEAVRAAVVP